MSERWPATCRSLGGGRRPCSPAMSGIRCASNFVMRCMQVRLVHVAVRVSPTYTTLQGFLRSFKGWDRYQRHTFIADNFSNPEVVCAGCVPLVNTLVDTYNGQHAW